MQDLIDRFLSLPVGGRAAIFVGILFLLWCILGRLILKILSILPWLLKNFFVGIYTVIEIPISILHKKYGSIFGVIDQGLTSITKKVYDLMDSLYLKTKKPHTIYAGWLLIVCLVIVAYLLIPIAANLREKPFTFWQQSYIDKETVAVQWMEDKGWFEK